MVCVAVAVAVAVSVLTETSNFDQGWKFNRGDCSNVSPAPVPPTPTGCNASLIRQYSSSPCTHGTTYGCYTGTNTMWVTKGCNGDFGCNDKTIKCGSNNYHHTNCSCAEAPPNPAPSGAYACAWPAFDDKAWRSLSVPHDWSIEDLPSREDDTEYPVLGVRYGDWKLQTGDDPAWAAPGFEDSAWMSAKGGEDWRVYGDAFKAINATGWYRQHVEIPATLINTTAPLLLSLGIVAGSDTVYVNGKMIGGSASPVPTTRDYVTVSAYPIPAELLSPDGPNVVAVRVESFGGAEPGPPMRSNGSFPGGLYDDPIIMNKDVRTGPFDAAASPAKAQGAYTLAGVGWYRKAFKLPPTGKRVALRFDGVYMDANVYVNGHWAGGWAYGYSTFEVDLTPFLTNSSTVDNVVAVRVSANGTNSRWYSGAGIYRHTWLSVRDPVHIPMLGVQVLAVPTLTAVGRASSATVAVNVTVVNTGTRPAVAQLAVVIGTGGTTATTVTGTASVLPGANTTATLSATLRKDIALWSTTAPRLYWANISIVTPGGTDAVTMSFGIRTVSFDSAHGFRLNGETVTMYGGCVHHANGPLGSMAIDRAEERRVETLQKLGYNAIRTSHNPVSPAFLDACDRLGMLVMAEAFDCWAQGKNPDDYHLYFWKWWQRDLAHMVLRDRNHPSIVLWSIGNEIPMRFTRTGASLAGIMRDMVHSMDPESGRGVTSAYPFFNDQDSPFLHQLDVPGYNYAGDGVYEKDHQKLPNRTMVGTESVAQDTWRVYGYLTSMEWVVGDFIWTAIDYYGDAYFPSTTGDVDYVSGRRPFPWHISNCGDVDVIGHQKPQSLYRTVVWGVSQMEMLVHRPSKTGTIMAPGLSEHISLWGWPDEVESWSWPGFEAAPVQVRVFARGCETVRLALGARMLGEAVVQANLTAVFVVPYLPGTLSATCVNGTAPVAGRPAISLTTESAPAKIDLAPDRVAITHSPDDLAYVTATLVDAAGIRVHNAAPVVTFIVTGPGELLAVGSGDPSDPTSLRQNTKAVWRGRAIAVVRPVGTVPGTITVTASVDGIPVATTAIITD